MSKLKAETLFDNLLRVTDPRRQHQKLHSLIDILVISVCATICGAEHWTEIEEFGKAKQEWFAQFLQLENGVPSHDTIGRVFSLLDSVQLKMSFLDWIQSAVNLSDGSLVNIDGKNLRGSKSLRSGKRALNVGARVGSSTVGRLGQVKCEDKSNEITALPELLKVLELKGCIVTIDAMGCQREIVKQIVEKEAEYVISLKGNQGMLHREVKEFMDWAERVKFKGIGFDYFESLEKGHGRIEKRRCWVTEEIDWLEQFAEWANLKSIIMVEAEREVIGGQKTIERRYFISSLEANAEQSLRAVRGHWAIENELHWCLDIGFREDDCRTREGNAPENLAIIRHIGINLLKQENSCQLGIKSKRLKAGWDEGYLLKVLKK